MVMFFRGRKAAGKTPEEWMKESRPPTLQSNLRKKAEKAVHYVNVLFLVDVSESMGQEIVSHVFEDILPNTLRTVQAKGKSSAVVFAVAIVAFNNNVADVVDWCSPEEAIALLGQMRISCGGATDIEQATVYCHDKIAGQKAKQDAQEMRRMGTVLITMTDGNAFVDGRDVEISETLEQKIKDCAESHAINPFVIGMGDISRSNIRKLGPATKGKDGEVENHGVFFLDKDYTNPEVFDLVEPLIEAGSSGPHGRPKLAYDYEKEVDSVNCVYVDPSHFEIVT